MYTGLINYIFHCVVDKWLVLHSGLTILQSNELETVLLFGLFTFVGHFSGVRSDCGRLSLLAANVSPLPV